MHEKAEKTPEQRATERASYFAGLLWHTGAFVIINVFLWTLDSLGEGGFNWAWWVTVMWGVGLAFHALAYFIDGRQVERRKADEFLRAEQDRVEERSTRS